MLAILDCRAPLEAEDALVQYGHTALRLPPHPTLPKPVASHPDMLLFFATDAVYTTKAYYEIARAELDLIKKTCEKELRICSRESGEKYPQDILLNAAPIGRYLFCHPTHTATELKLHPAYTVCSVRQGYAKCATIPIGDNALITADPSIASAACARGLDVLRLHTCGTRLDGYNTGFPGGAASCFPYKRSKDLFFCGSLSAHPQAQEIEAFCKTHGYRPISLGEFPLTDVGTMFFI